MKKNIKFRNNGNSNAYSLNYKFDSISPAGKVNGTALELIKRYNELAKEAHGSGDYIEMEVYRQYAEHYRKIVTEINERKNAKTEMQANGNAGPENEPAAEAAGRPSGSEPRPETTDNAALPNGNPAAQPKKSFKIVEIKNTDSLGAETAAISENGGRAGKKIRGTALKLVRQPAETADNNGSSESAAPEAAAENPTAADESKPARITRRRKTSEAIANQSQTAI